MTAYAIALEPQIIEYDIKYVSNDANVKMADIKIAKLPKKIKRCDTFIEFLLYNVHFNNY